MKTENLEIRTYNNYKELCNTLGIEVKAGKSKQLQMKELTRFCNYKKQGNKIIITDIFPTPLPKVDGRGGARENAGNKSGLVEDITDLARILLNENNGYLEFTPKYLRMAFALMRDRTSFDVNFKPDKHGKNINQVYVDYYSYLKSLLDNQIDTLINRLSKTNAFGVERTYYTWTYIDDENNGWKDRKLVNPYELYYIKMIEAKAFNTFNEENKIKHNKGYLFYNQLYSNQYEEYKNTLYSLKFGDGTKYCKAIVFNSSNHLEVSRKKYEITDSLKAKYRLKSLKHILGVTRKRGVLSNNKYIHYVAKYSDEDIIKLKQAHDKLFGKENWNSEEIQNIIADKVEKLSKGKIEKPKKKKKKVDKPMTADEQQDEVDLEIEYNELIKDKDKILMQREALKGLGKGSTEWIEKALEIGAIDKKYYQEIEKHINVVDLVTNPYNPIFDEENFNNFTINKSEEELRNRIKAIATSEQLKQLNKLNVFNDFMDKAYSFGLVEKPAETLERIKILKKALIDDYIKRINNGEKFKTFYFHSEIALENDRHSGFINPQNEWDKIYKTNLIDDDNPFND